MPEYAALLCLVSMVALALGLFDARAWLVTVGGAALFPLLLLVVELARGGFRPGQASWATLFLLLIAGGLGGAAAVIGLLSSVAVQACWDFARDHARAWAVLARTFAVGLALAPPVACVSVFGLPLLPFVAPSDDFKTAVAVSVCDADPVAGESERGAYCVELPAERFRELVAAAEYRYDRGLWKGGSLVVARLPGGRARRLGVSYYGAFFKTDEEPGMWVVEGARAEDFRREFGRIVQQELRPGTAR